MKNLLLFFLILLTCTACYWHLRNPDEVPPQFKVLYLNSDDVDSHFKVQLINLLRSMKITLAPKSRAANFTLNVYDYSLEHDNPDVSSTNVAITYTYTLTVTANITDANGHVVVPAHTIETTRDVTVNTNQIFTINSTSIFQEELQREAINLLYYWMTSDKTRHQINTPWKKPTKVYATQSTTTTSAP